VGHFAFDAFGRWKADKMQTKITREKEMRKTKTKRGRAATVAALPVAKPMK
jgi:hypothetical protein